MMSERGRLERRRFAPCASERDSSLDRKKREVEELRDDKRALLGELERKRAEAEERNLTLQHHLDK